MRKKGHIIHVCVVSTYREYSRSSFLNTVVRKDECKTTKELFDFDCGRVDMYLSTGLLVKVILGLLLCALLSRVAGKSCCVRGRGNTIRSDRQRSRQRQRQTQRQSIIRVHLRLDIVARNNIDQKIKQVGFGNCHRNVAGGK
jgi:hypothetical protein